MNADDMVPANRLLDAVDAALRAMAELGDHPLAASPSKLMGHALQPQVLCDFTLAQIRAAEGFLIRCGMLESGSQPRI